MSDVEDFLHDVIATLDATDSPKADRAAMLASDLLMKMGAAREDTCIARAMGYRGPTGAVAVSSVVARVLTRSHAALREFGPDVDLQTVTAGLAAAARIIRRSVSAEHAGCLVYMMRTQPGASALAPKGVSHHAPKAAEPPEGDA